MSLLSPVYGKQIVDEGAFGAELHELSWPRTEPIPAWLPQLAEAIGGSRFNAESILETVPSSELWDLRVIVASSPDSQFLLTFCKATAEN